MRIISQGIAHNEDVGKLIAVVILISLFLIKNN